MSYKIERLSKYIFDDENYNKLANRIYYVTDHLTKDYPHHYEWYYQTHLPGVRKGNREVFFVQLHDNICGAAFVKKTDDEKKICTFYIAEYARKATFDFIVFQRDTSWYIDREKNKQTNKKKTPSILI